MATVAKKPRRRARKVLSKKASAKTPERSKDRRGRAWIPTMKPGAQVLISEQHFMTIMGGIEAAHGRIRMLELRLEQILHDPF